MIVIQNCINNIILRKYLLYVYVYVYVYKEINDEADV